MAKHGTDLQNKLWSPRLPAQTEKNLLEAATAEAENKIHCADMSREDLKNMIWATRCFETDFSALVRHFNKGSPLIGE